MPGQAKCPICGSPAQTDFRPFCSRRCADVDLGRWLKGAYVIPDWRDATKDEREGDLPSEPGQGEAG